MNNGVKSLVVQIITVLGPTVAARHDENCIQAWCRVCCGYQFHDPVMEYLELGKSRITLFFRHFCTVIPVCLSVSASVGDNPADHLNLM